MDPIKDICILLEAEIEPRLITPTATVSHHALYPHSYSTLIHEVVIMRSKMITVKSRRVSFKRCWGKRCKNIILPIKLHYINQ